jgi:DNA-directed RNA polymerase specialized sigma24 family protein
MPARTHNKESRMSAILDQGVAAFEAHRHALTGLAYRMLGSRAEAEDVVQDAYLRWHNTDRAEVRGVISAPWWRGCASTA